MNQVLHLLDQDLEVEERLMEKRMTIFLHAWILVPFWENFRVASHLKIFKACSVLTRAANLITGKNEKQPEI